MIIPHTKTALTSTTLKMVLNFKLFLYSSKCQGSEPQKRLSSLFTHIVIWAISLLSCMNFSFLFLVLLNLICLFVRSLILYLRLDSNSTYSTNWPWIQRKPSALAMCGELIDGQLVTHSWPESVWCWMWTAHMRIVIRSIKSRTGGGYCYAHDSSR